MLVWKVFGPLPRSPKGKNMLKTNVKNIFKANNEKQEQFLPILFVICIVNSRKNAAYCSNVFIATF